MAWTTPRTWVAGEVVTAALMNTHLRDNLLASLGLQWLYVDGAALRPDLTNGCDVPIDQTLTAGSALLTGAGFSGTADQYAQFKLALPKRWDASTIQYRVRWSSNSAGAGDVVFANQAVACTDGDAIDTALGTAVNVTDTFQAVKKQHTTALSAAVTVGNTPSKEDVVYFRFGRLATNGSDTKAEKVYVEGVELFITPNTVNDA